MGVTSSPSSRSASPSNVVTAFQDPERIAQEDYRPPLAIQQSFRFKGKRYTIQTFETISKTEYFVESLKVFGMVVFYAVSFSTITVLVMSILKMINDAICDDPFNCVLPQVLYGCLISVRT
jgi:hypothetical protein